MSTQAPTLNKAREHRIDMLALIEHDDDQLAVPLAQLASASKHAATKEAIADWHYWLARGYQF